DQKRHGLTTQKLGSSEIPSGKHCRVRDTIIVLSVDSRQTSWLSNGNRFRKLHFERVIPRGPPMSRQETSEAQRRDGRMLSISIPYSAALLAPAAVLLAVWPRLATNLFATGFGGQVFMPHGMCYLWVPQLWLLHVSSDLLIGVSYVAISSTLIYLIYRAR